jgi:hypothetical protein
LDNNRRLSFIRSTVENGVLWINFRENKWNQDGVVRMEIESFLKFDLKWRTSFMEYFYRILTTAQKFKMAAMVKLVTQFPIGILSASEPV